MSTDQCSSIERIFHLPRQLRHSISNWKGNLEVRRLWKNIVSTWTRIVEFRCVFVCVSYCFPCGLTLVDAPFRLPCCPFWQCLPFCCSSKLDNYITKSSLLSVMAVGHHCLVAVSSVVFTVAFLPFRHIYFVILLGSLVKYGALEW